MSLLLSVHAKLSLKIAKYDALQFSVWLILSFGAYVGYNATVDNWVSWDLAHFTFAKCYSDGLFYLVVFFVGAVSFLVNLAMDVAVREFVQDPKDLIRSKNSENFERDFSKAVKF